MNYHRLSGAQKLRYSRQANLAEYEIYRCKHCRVGVIKRDRAGHLLRCQGIEVDVWRHFLKGAPYARPRRGRPPKLIMATA